MASIVSCEVGVFIENSILCGHGESELSVDNGMDVGCVVNWCTVPWSSLDAVASVVFVFVVAIGAIVEGVISFFVLDAFGVLNVVIDWSLGSFLVSVGLFVVGVICLGVGVITTIGCLFVVNGV